MRKKMANKEDFVGTGKIKNKYVRITILMSDEERN